MARTLVLQQWPASTWLADHTAALLIGAGAVLATLPFAWILADVLTSGWTAVSWQFLSALPRQSGRAGGIFPILVSTLLITAVTLIVVVPFGLAAAIFLSETTRGNGLFARAVGLSLDVLAGVPSIVFGLFGNAFFCVFLGMGFSILSGGLTLACMALPLFVRAAEVGLSAVPEDWKCGGLALGMSYPALLWHIILPAAGHGIAVAVVLSVGRALAETAALVFTSGYVDRMPGSLMDSGRSLSVHIYDLSMNIAGGERNAYASVLVLIGLIGLINAVTYLVTEKVLRRRMIES